MYHALPISSAPPCLNCFLLLHLLLTELILRALYVEQVVYLREGKARWQQWLGAALDPQME